ncbi:MAG: M23 family metallopeptidase [Cryomorphaceae bacterium]|nr:M23 family metallopeptidase [Cryomorphaceae bacterium]
MAKVKYYYDQRSLSYKKIELSTWDRFRNTTIFILAAGLFAFLGIVLADNFVESPKEKALNRELENLQLHYDVLNNRLDNLSLVLEDMQKRDDNIYRVIFEADPIPTSIRKAGFGGVNRYKELEGFDNANLVKETTEKLDVLTKQTYIQSRSFDEVINMAKNKSNMLASIPAIQPIANKDLTRIASGFGYRFHPIHKIKKLHTGMDFTAPTGTPIYATGNGVVSNDPRKRAAGYGNYVVLDHGYGYQTLYGHMSKVNVRTGQKVKRGEVIGFVGNTGTSTAPHLHYEVIKNGRKINPVNFFYNDLTPEEYEQMIILSSQENQSFD